jgi:hypothetical protein
MHYTANGRRSGAGRIRGKRKAAAG